MTGAITTEPDPWADLVDDEELHEMQDNPGYLAYLQFLESEEARGELAGHPDTMACYACCGFDGRTSIERLVVKLGPVIAQRFDATQTYVLECGHTAIAC